MNSVWQYFNAVAGNFSFLLSRGLRATAVFLVGVLALAASACDSVPSAPDITDIPLPTISTNGLVDNPRPTEVVPPTRGPEPTAAPDPVPVTSSPIDGSSTTGAIPVPRLVIAEIPADLPAYSRKDWKHWNDTDGDCQDTRAEVLIIESATSPTFATDRGCRVTGGRWNGLYTGQTFTEAGDLDIDHLVPLKNAHLSGGWQWDEERKEDYANSMASDYHLIAVEKYANRSKGARGPEEWQPPDVSYHCRYSRDWIAVKADWGLTATAAEWEALEAMLATCAHPLATGEGTAAIAPSPAPTPTTEPFTGSLVISEIMPDPSAVRDTAGEWFEVHNPDKDQGISLQGWTIRKDGGDEHRISTGLVVPLGGYVVLARNGDAEANGGIGATYEYGGVTLTNNGDAIELVEPAGQVVDRVEYNEDLVFAGASTSLDPGSLNVDANNDEASWCRALTAMPNGDFGTPGQENDACR